MLTAEARLPLCMREECRNRVPTKHHKYCSRACSNPPTQKPGNCLICGKPCTRRGYKYCSRPCSVVGLRGKRQAPSWISTESVLVYTAIQQLAAETGGRLTTKQRDRAIADAKEKAKAIRLRDIAPKGGRPC